MKRMRVTSDFAPTEEDLQQMLEESGPEADTPPAIAVIWDDYTHGGGDPYGDLRLVDPTSGHIFTLSLSPDGQGMYITPIEVVQRPDLQSAVVVPHGADGNPDWAYISKRFFPGGVIRA